ncbi:hypothetical protein Z948_2519 [Sulfitobacter donghicola DSW-25 = KCTC 12864 = JCM 14565]|uniref:Uncharacterized protein n=1 Tax=Sulfitobacter donghicola DSW-25 = KCTC 12864 = JCM 14565 TaxID=1300350 RepID=A0A073IF54_9RHOB|nr:hypothetical protein DSW25_16095 [Sulfitobacter donghicola DSW-25 = KCTC 12864 = JCM 14565]KIN68787.1 hypothetical protein Z948_2519 [Sulfitobacter donghicola DSW-25 = KCTC 12864 = JCM 14565]
MEIRIGWGAMALPIFGKNTLIAGSGLSLRITVLRVQFIPAIETGALVGKIAD